MASARPEKPSAATYLSGARRLCPVLNSGAGADVERGVSPCERSSSSMSRAGRLVWNYFVPWLRLTRGGPRSTR